MTDQPDAQSLAQSVVLSALGILETEAGTLEIYKIPQWDSLGQLKVILRLEEVLGISIQDEMLFETLSSVDRIANFIQTRFKGSL
jgi:acyl carrier protein